MQLTTPCKVLVVLFMLMATPIFIGGLMLCLSKWIYPPKYYGARGAFGALVLAIGTTERLLTVLLICFVPSLLVYAVGAWIGLKYASNWMRDEPFAREKTLLALFGTTWSIGIAAIVGFTICPDALHTVWK